MYVSSFGTSTVLRYDAATGTFLGLLTPEPEKAPQGTAFFTNASNQTTFYVASRDGNDILQYDGTTGKFLGQFVSSNPALNGGLKQPVGIAFDSTRQALRQQQGHEPDPAATTPTARSTRSSPTGPTRRCWATSCSPSTSASTTTSSTSGPSAPTRS